MPSLPKADNRFMHRLEIVEGGSGFFMGLIDEPPQSSIPVFQFVNARRVLRVNLGCPVKVGMVIRTKGGPLFMVGNLGDSEDIFNSYRLVEVTGTYDWQTRHKEIDPITLLEHDDSLIAAGTIYGSYEPAATEMFDRAIRSSFETARLVTNRDVKVDDIINDKRVSRADKQLGLTVLTVG